MKASPSAVSHVEDVGAAEESLEVIDRISLLASVLIDKAETACPEDAEKYFRQFEDIIGILSRMTARISPGDRARLFQKRLQRAETG